MIVHVFTTGAEGDLTEGRVPMACHTEAVRPPTAAPAIMMTLPSHSRPEN
jgi:hypothetical protein